MQGVLAMDNKTNDKNNSQFDELYYKEMRADRRCKDIEKKVSITNFMLFIIAIALICLVITQIPDFLIQMEKIRLLTQ